MTKPPPPPLRVRPIDVPRNPPEIDEGRPRRRSSWGTFFVVVGAFVLVAGLVAVFWVLPKWVANRPETGTPEITEETTTPPLEEQQKMDAEATLVQVEEAWRRLTARSVGLWAPVRSRELKAQLGRSRELAKNGPTAEAATLLEEVSAGLAEINESAVAIADEAVSEGRRRLESGNAASATASFERALLVDPDSSQARQGLVKAAGLAEALQALERGGGFERSGNFVAAAGQYRIAIQRVPWFQEARLALARVQQDERETAYAQVLTDGLAALEKGQWEIAESALARAGSLRPGAPEVEDGLLRLRSRRRLEKIARLQDAARNFEVQESWFQAVATYTEILELTPASLTAEQGKQRATERYEVEAKLKGHLAHPDRLSETAVLDDARSLVVTAESVPVMGPRLQEQVNQLKNLVRRMSTPMPVEILSDGRTEVTIYRVGRLGRFEYRVVEVLPGSYTVVGARSGFRDVRLTLEVRVGEKPAPLAVRCEDAL